MASYSAGNEEKEANGTKGSDADWWRSWVVEPDPFIPNNTITSRSIPAIFDIFRKKLV
jgi:hypothetical protein